MHENAILLICFAAALAVWVAARHAWKGRALLWLDAAGIAAYATYGAAKGLAFGLAPLPAMAMGVLTACLGGIIRDVLAGEPSTLMRPELYVTAAALVGGADGRPAAGRRSGRARRRRRRVAPASRFAPAPSISAGSFPAYATTKTRGLT